jgi:type I restriction enzyme S subunit
MTNIQTLNAICSLIVDCPHSTPAWTDSGYLVLRNQNIKNGKLDLSNPSFTDENHFNARNRRAKPSFGDIVITREAPMGDVCMIPNGLECCLGQRQVLLRPNPEVVNPRYILYALQSEFVQHQISWNEGTGSTVSNLRIPVLESLNVPTPSIEEQHAIAHILGTLDEKIELNRQQNETLEAMARGLFKAWFVDFEPVRAKMEGRWQRGQSLPGLPAYLYDLFPGRLVESELGEIPEGWAVGSFADAVEIIGGGTPKTSVSEYWDGDIPWFSVVDTPAASDIFVVQTEKSITQTGLNGSSARLITKGTTIISARGTVGNLAIAGCDMTFNQSCYALRGKNGSGNYFVFLSAQYMVEQLKSMAHGSVFSTITRQTFEAVRAVLPPENMLKQFERNATSLLNPILGNVNESRSLAQLRDTLLPKLISGELRVQDAEALCTEERTR